MKADNNPLVSVVIPSYNHARYIGQALRSVMEQTYSNWEVVVVDNHSEDNTEQIVIGFSDPRISLIKIRNNGVIAVSRNSGIKAARGDWVAFLDSDDWWKPNKMQACMNLALSGDGCDLVYHDLTCVKRRRQLFSIRRSRSRQLPENAFSDLMKNGNALPNSSVIVRKESLMRINCISEDRRKIAWEDFDTWLRLAKNGCRFGRVRGSYGYYWVGGGNVSNSERTIANLNAFAKEYIKVDAADKTTLKPWWYYYTSALCYQQLKELTLAEWNFKMALSRARPKVNRVHVLGKYILFKAGNVFRRVFSLV